MTKLPVVLSYSAQPAFSWRWLGALFVFGLAIAGTGPAMPQGQAAGTSDAGSTPVACTMTPAEVFQKAGRGVVQVVSLGIDPFRVAGRVRPAQGSGIVLDDDLVLTNLHVVSEARLVAVMAGDAFLEAQVVGRDPVLDVALLKVPGIGLAAPPLEIAPAGAIEVGEPAHVIGFPLGLGKSISTGIVSGLGRIEGVSTTSWLAPFIQTDAPVSAGNSGGPLLDSCGRVIGMVARHIESPLAESVGFAIPAAALSEILPELRETGKVARPWHGIYGQMVTPDIYVLLGLPPEVWSPGFLVETVEPGSAADRAGLRGGTLPVKLGMREIILGGDIIKSVNGRPITSMADAVGTVRSLKIGEEVTIEFLRDGKTMTKTVTIEERPALERDLERYRQR